MSFAGYPGILRRPLLLAAGFLCFLSLSRLFLVHALSDRVEPTGGLSFILLQGLRFDLIITAQLFGIVFLLKPFLHGTDALRRMGAWLVPVYLALVCALGFLVEASTLSFIREFDVRPNHLFVDYLAYPREVFAMLVRSQPGELLALSLLTALIGASVFAWCRKDPSLQRALPLRVSLAALPLVAIFLLASIRSTLDHRPINPSKAAFSNDTMVNQLALNSPYSLIFDLYERNRDQHNSGYSYGRIEEHEALAIIRQEADIPAHISVLQEVPTLHYHRATHRREKPLNLVIIIQESLGAEFVQSLGGQAGLTPEIDALQDQGIWFERLYATGTRSVRGVESVVTGFPPTPRFSVVKLAETQTGFFTLASLLRDKGYHTRFMYGGHAHFDNMRRFLLNNGFHSIIDQADIENPQWVGSWGVSDEDLLMRAHREFEAAGDQPFLTVILTTTHHKPFDIPAGKVQTVPGPEGKRATAVRYADYALGRFLEAARQSSYWDNTAIYVTSDHNSRVYGDQLVPINRFHIPGAIVGGPVEPRRIPGISSQIDMLPTLLSLAGIDGYHPAIGRDLTEQKYFDGAGRAVMQFYHLQAYLEDDRVVVLAPFQQPRTFRLQEQALLKSLESDRQLERRALAYANWGPQTIRNRAYRPSPDLSRRVAKSDTEQHETTGQ